MSCDHELQHQPWREGSNTAANYVSIDREFITLIRFLKHK